jgi:hypothetical protein
MSKNSLEAEHIERAMKAVYKKAKIRCKTYISEINNEGAIRC